ncbi:MAG: hypothetical protein M1501_03085 [Candidatus Omnitrophica bacterium]|nr:hypothetical protein [Candidatus Omnitrophota bacterium]
MYNIINQEAVSQVIHSGLLPKNLSSGELSKIISSGVLPKNIQSGKIFKILQTEKSMFFMGGGMTQLIISFLLGAIGIGYFIYGRKQHLIIAMLAGVALNIIPFFISSIFLMILISIIIMIIPWFMKF